MRIKGCLPRGKEAAAVRVEVCLLPFVAFQRSENKEKMTEQWHCSTGEVCMCCCCVVLVGVCTLESESCLGREQLTLVNQIWNGSYINPFTQ